MLIKIIIVDDDMLITNSLNIILGMDERFEVVGIGHNGKEAVALCEKHEVDVALLDIRMPEMTGVDATKEIVEKTNTKVLILTTFSEDDYIQKAFEFGAKGYLFKNTPPEQIMNSVVAVYGGTAVVEESIINKMNVKKSNCDERINMLTNREQDIVKAIAEGLTNKEIAERLFISEGTVKNNITTILGKLNLKHRTHIAIYYLKNDS